MHYRPEIDGLRAVAVLPVILFHAGYKGFSGGFVGVDIFFVISGFLITSIVLKEIDQQKFSIVNFYERRARRILPALFAVIAVSLILSWNSLSISDMRDYLKSIVAVMTFSSNVLFWTEADYFDTAADLKPLLHTWSLAVEEQFYIVLPLILILARKLRRRWLLSLCIVAATVSLGCAQWASERHPMATFYLLHTRSWELLIGSILAFISLYKHPQIERIRNQAKLAQIGETLGLLLIIVSIYKFNKSTPFPSLYALVPTIGTALIIFFANAQSFIGKQLSNPILVKIGMISYSAYLWHQPLFAYTRRQFFPEPPTHAFPILIALVFILAYASWRFIETPFRNRQKISRKAIFLFAIAGSLAYISVGAFGLQQNGFEKRTYIINQLVEQYEPDNRKLQQDSWQHLSTFDGFNAQWSPNDQRKKLLLVGNSHSKDIYNILLHSQDAQRRFQTIRYGAQVRYLTDEFFQSTQYHQADTILVASRYHRHDLQALPQLVQQFLDDKKQVVLVKNIYEMPNNETQTLADHLFTQKFASAYSQGTPATEIVQQINRHHFQVFRENPRNQQLLASDETINQLAQRHPQITVLDRMDYAVNKEQKSFYSIDHQFQKYYYDYGHHTLAGVAFFGARVDSIQWLDF